MTAPDPRCPICDRLLPPPRAVPDGAWPAKARTYCSQACATRATAERRRVLPGPSEVLLALAKARVVIRLDASGALRSPTPESGVPLDEAMRRALGRHHTAIADAVTRAHRCFVAHDLGSVSPTGWLACSACGWPKLTTTLGHHCSTTYGCPGVLAIALDRVFVETPEIHPDDRAQSAVIRAFPGAAVVPGSKCAHAQPDRAAAWSR